MNSALPTPDNPHPGMGFKQFVGLIAMMMATNAIAIDSMLPSLPEIGQALNIDTANHTQLIITSYLLGFGAAQIVYGPLADRFGRRSVLLVGMVIYTIASLGAAFATSFEVMMMARALQGVGAAATRILAVAIVRDCYSGRQMARVMSLAFIVFLAVPVIAPSIGQLIVLVAPWRAIFGMLLIFGTILIFWIVARLPETLHPDDRIPISSRGIAYAFGLVLRSRISVGYMFAMTMIMSGLFAFITSAQQVFADVFNAAGLFTMIFAGIALFMAMSSFLNARIVERLGMRRVSHAALLGYLAVTCTHAVLVMMGHESLLLFVVLQAVTMFFFGLVVSNFNAMAMEPVGHVAGTASSLLGFTTTIGGAVMGSSLGQMFDGTTLPLTLGFALFGIGALGFVLFAERGRLFGAHSQNVSLLVKK
ncbi:multidrug effflux MFS transporter [Ancylobacter sp. Lp-2]|uniref:multidrug effflux MFS transporter n=1 Tax=Ancylobacter sp. Lp-2 TaxID=2881339 RepID=UPI001E59134C|nr:multidrug effflux MFS transporter [Ancylobacter sp. Lp-2]MCB4769545.1 multidrug effflux MFS transporter [Ancylobacter sp. Lp-2]